MNRLLIVVFFLIGCLFHAEAQAGGIGLNVFGGRGVNVQVGRAFAPQQVLVQRQFVPRQQVFVQRQFVAQPQRVFVQRQFHQPAFVQRQFFAAPVYNQSFGFSSGYGLQSSFGFAPSYSAGFASGGCGALLSY